VHLAPLYTLPCTLCGIFCACPSRSHWSEDWNSFPVSFDPKLDNQCSRCGKTILGIALAAAINNRVLIFMIWILVVKNLLFFLDYGRQNMCFGNFRNIKNSICTSSSTSVNIVITVVMNDYILTWGLYSCEWDSGICSKWKIGFLQSLNCLFVSFQWLKLVWLSVKNLGWK
jgi:hypothetical protein